MREIELSVFESAAGGARTVEELSEAVGEPTPLVAAVVTTLEERNFLSAAGHVTVADTEQVDRLCAVLETHGRAALTDGREAVLECLLEGVDPLDDCNGPAAEELLSRLRTDGVVRSDGNGYRLTSDCVRAYLRSRTGPERVWYGPGGDRIVRGTDGGDPTAYSAFRSYGLDYSPDSRYGYRGDGDVGLPEVFVHALRTAERTEHLAYTVALARKHYAVLQGMDVPGIADLWGCRERLADVSAFMGPGDPDEALFPSMEEYREVVEKHGVELQDHHTAEDLRSSLRAVGDALTEPVSVYLVGGANLVLRGAKRSTKDIDAVITDEAAVGPLWEALDRLGYVKPPHLNDDGPGVTAKGVQTPIWDVLVGALPSGARITEGVHRRSETDAFGSLTVHTVSPSDLFVLLATAARIDDVESLVSVGREFDLDWRTVHRELQVQDRSTDPPVLSRAADSIEQLRRDHGVEVPIHDQVVAAASAEDP